MSSYRNYLNIRIYLRSFYTELIALFVVNYIALHIGDVPA